MKNFFTFIMLFSFLGLAFSQTFVEEKFDGSQMPPENWTIDGYTDQWSIEAAANAGSEAPEAKFTYIQSVGVSRLISPSVDLSSLSSVTLMFNQFYDNYSGTDPSIGVATRSNGGEWNVAWELSPAGDVGPETRFINIETDDVGSSDFQFCIYIDGNFYNMDYWFIDNIVLYNAFDLDAKLSSITTPSYVTGPTDVTGIVTNFGNNEITSLGISWQVNDGPINTTQLDGLSIETNENYDFTCDDQFDFGIGAYELNVWIDAVNGGDDDDLGNNQLSKIINVISNTVAKKPLYEEFTSSTCAPCAGFNTSFVPWTVEHVEDITLVKYQMSWPAPGDPYYTAEGGTRRTYYGVSAVPDLMGDGNNIGANMGAVNSFYNSAIASPAYMSMVGSHTLTGTTIDVTANVLPYANFTNAKVHIVVFEYATHNNTGNNGETEFHHVMMKMLPDANGTTSDLIDREPITINEQFDLASTNVEQFDDLGIAIFIQDANKTIYQSGYSIENAVYATEARLESASLDGINIEEFNSDIFEYDINLPSNTTIVPQIEGLGIDENSIVIVVPATELPGSTIIDVFGEDLNSHNRYTFNFILEVGLQSPIANLITLYPNPNSGTFKLSNVPTNSKVNLVDISGRLVLENINHQETIDINSLNNGIYFINIITPNETITKRFTLKK